MPLLSKIQSLLYADVGIDLGTKNTVIYIKDQGVVLSEPSMVALDEQTRDVVAFGQEAYDMIGKTPAHIISARPMREGVIADFTMAEKMIQSFLESIRHHISMKKPRLLFGIPWGITTVEKRAVLNAGRLSGVKHPMLIDEPMAAAIGSGLDVQAPNGKLIIDFMNAHKVMKYLVNEEEKEIEGIKFHITRTYDDTHIEKHVKFNHKDEHYHFTERVQRLKLDDFKTLLAPFFTIDHVFGSLDLQPFVLEKSDRLIIIATRKNEL